MSQFAIKQYQSEVEKIIQFGGTKKETAIRTAFYNLLNEYAKSKGLMMVPEVTIKAANGKNITPDGTLKDTLRQDWGYWESKDESDKIDDEIEKKFAKGYPKYNILFEDSQTAVLIQNGIEKMRVSMAETAALDRLINEFINFERPEVQNFRKAIELFKQDIPKVTETLRGIIIAQENTNPKFKDAGNAFLKLCHDSINPNVTMDDVREMIIQHILTEDIFNTIFDETQFHRENNIAHQLEKVIETFFTGNTKRMALSTIQHYYQTINAAAAGIADHHEKQMFLKVVYETFYKSYNPKAADRLGVVYTPNEIVKFMIQSTDYLLNKHFGKLLEDKGVEILDPATGTGTFICDIIDYLRKEHLPYKYTEEIHANEVAILPYYISNLNIEFTYKQKTGQYKEFQNLCFVDTLDNMGFTFRGKQGNLFEPFTEENSKRIKRQNDKKISVIIGNPPYNANQLNENENNKNREYPEIDKRIKDTYIANSTAQKTKLYDMYARFLRWSSDRLDDNGVIAFVSNNSFIDSRTYDGFRKTVQKEFNYLYIINLKGNARTSGERRRQEAGNVFHDQIRVGVAIYFFVKKKGERGCNIFYNEIKDYVKAEEKLSYISENTLKELPFEHIAPDKNNNWINLTDNDFDTLLPVADKDVKLGRSKKALFELFSLGVVTARDEWVYGEKEEEIEKQVRYLIGIYNKDLTLNIGKDKNKIKDLVDYSIKWTRAVKNDLSKGKQYNFDKNLIIESLYRPFIKKKLYFSRELNEMQYQLPILFRGHNQVISISGSSASKPFSTLVTDTPYCYDLLEKTQCLPLFRYNENGNRIDNITDWGLNQFRKHYKLKRVKTEKVEIIQPGLAEKDVSKPDIEPDEKYDEFDQPNLKVNKEEYNEFHERKSKYKKKGISKEDIFHYVYAILHNPAYRKKYELNLKREFPRIPFYDDFHKWVAWGKTLMDLHINYETVTPYPLKEITVKDISNPKCKLKADKDSGTIILDEATTLSGVPAEAWDYKLGNRSALEWILDQYKEKKPSDPTIAEKFNTYRFADYKDKVIDLLKRVCTVSVETVKIVGEMEETNINLNNILNENEFKKNHA